MSFDASLRDEYYADPDESGDDGAAVAAERRSWIGFHAVLAVTVVLAWMFSLTAGFVWLDSWGANLCGKAAGAEC